MLSIQLLRVYVNCFYFGSHKKTLVIFMGKYYETLKNEGFLFKVKADKKAEREKQEKVEQERMDREDEMRELSIKLRKRYFLIILLYNI